MEVPAAVSEEVKPSKHPCEDTKPRDKIDKYADDLVFYIPF